MSIQLPWQASCHCFCVVQLLVHGGAQTPASSNTGQGHLEKPSSMGFAGKGASCASEKSGPLGTGAAELALVSHRSLQSESLDAEPDIRQQCLELEVRRKERNKQAQQRYRDKRKDQTSVLSREVHQLKAKVSVSERSIKRIQQENAGLRSQVDPALAGQIANTCANSTQAKIAAASAARAARSAAAAAEAAGVVAEGEGMDRTRNGPAKRRSSALLSEAQLPGAVTHQDLSMMQR
ncbi:MAG: hypothetical protein WDW38_001782 [Sanguina aurantia]